MPVETSDGRAARKRRAVLVVAVVTGALAVVGMVRAGMTVFGAARSGGRSIVQAKRKQAAFEGLLREGWVSLYLDARRPGVDVPPPLKGRPNLVLQYGRDMPVPIPDLKVTDQGVSATLSFDQSTRFTHVPWTAVFAIVNQKGQGTWFAEDAPREVTERR